jgi:hypothetical protein
MKKLIIALLISSVVSGQKIDTAKTSFDKCHPIGSKDLNISVGSFQSFRSDISYKVKDTVPLIGYGAQIGDVVFGQPKPLPKDTIPAMLLITDTSIAKPTYEVFAIKGYMVIQNEHIYGDLMNGILAKRPIYYLNENKKPLPNDIGLYGRQVFINL